MNRRKWIILVFAVVIYFGILPRFWLDPKVRLRSIPEVVSLNEDLLIELLISAWHPNMLIEDVRLIVDWEHSDALKGKARLPPLTLYTGKRQPSWSFWTINRVTWPRRRTMKLTVPIKELAEKEVLQAGLLRGAVFVEVNTPQMWSTVATWLGRLGRTRTLRTPFEIQLRSTRQTTPRLNE